MRGGRRAEQRKHIKARVVQILPPSVLILLLRLLRELPLCGVMELALTNPAVGIPGLPSLSSTTSSSSSSDSLYNGHSCGTSSMPIRLHPNGDTEGVKGSVCRSSSFESFEGRLHPTPILVSSVLLSQIVLWILLMLGTQETVTNHHI